MRIKDLFEKPNKEVITNYLALGKVREKFAEYGKTYFPLNYLLNWTRCEGAYEVYLTKPFDKRGTFCDERDRHIYNILLDRATHKFEELEKEYPFLENIWVYKRLPSDDDFRDIFRYVINCSETTINGLWEEIQDSFEFVSTKTTLVEILKSKNSFKLMATMFVQQFDDLIYNHQTVYCSVSHMIFSVYIERVLGYLFYESYFVEDYVGMSEKLALLFWKSSEYFGHKRYSDEYIAEVIAIIDAGFNIYKLPHINEEPLVYDYEN